MEIFLLIASHTVVGVLCFFFGVDSMRKKLERELLEVINEHAKMIEDEINKL
jgi:hypothetical protein